jgi:hypothetical protein
MGLEKVAEELKKDVESFKKELVSGASVKNI